MLQPSKVRTYRETCGGGTVWWSGDTVRWLRRNQMERPDGTETETPHQYGEEKNTKKKKAGVYKSVV